MPDAAALPLAELFAPFTLAPTLMILSPQPGDAITGNSAAVAFSCSGRGVLCFCVDPHFATVNAPSCMAFDPVLDGGSKEVGK